MKKILFAAFLILVMKGASAQCVPDGSITEPGIYPDSATGLPHAVVGSAYSTVIQLKVITDTIILGSPATVDSILITGVDGLPSGFTYQCTPSSCHFPGGSNACILLSGPAPTAGMAGQIYPINVHTIAYGHLGPIPASLPTDVTRYRIVIDPATGIASFVNDKFEVSQNTPNPFSKSTEIMFNSPASEMLTLKVSNLLGKIVYTRPIFAQRGMNRVALSSRDFDPGIYIYTLGNAKTSVTKRMIVSNE